MSKEERASGNILARTKPGAFPCLNCPDRKPACQSHCEKYLTAKAEYDKQAAAIRKAKAAENDVYEYNKNRAIAAKKKIKGKDA